MRNYHLTTVLPSTSHTFTQEKEVISVSNKCLKFKGKNYHRKQLNCTMKVKYLDNIETLNNLDKYLFQVKETEEMEF